MKKRVIDLAVVFICLTVIGTALLYPDQVRGGTAVVLTAAVICCICLPLAVRDKDRGRETTGIMKKNLPSEPELITEIVLLNEEDKPLMTWDLYGKTAMVIGRDVGENQVDIDLGQSSYASMVEIEHAVLNYSAGSWYVEDLGSSNGIRIKKAGDGRLYNLSVDTPCRLERGDCLYIGLNRLLVR